MVREKRINDGGKSLDRAFYCECGCREWGLDEEIMKRVEEIHFRARKLEQKAQKLRNDAWKVQGGRIMSIFDIKK